MRGRRRPRAPKTKKCDICGHLVALRILLFAERVKLAYDERNGINEPATGGCTTLGGSYRNTKSTEDIYQNNNHGDTNDHDENSNKTNKNNSENNNANTTNKSNDSGNNNNNDVNNKNTTNTKTKTNQRT